MPQCRVIVLGCLLLGTAVAAQTTPSPSALVVDIPADALYHQPGCPLVRQAGSKVRVMKQSEAVRRGLEPHDCGDADPGQAEAREVNASTVLVQEKDTRYHKTGCARLKDGARTIALDEAGKKYWPCPVCKPPIRKNSKS